MITTKNLKWIAIILPIFFLGAILTVRARFGSDQTTVFVEIFLFALIVLGIISFSTWIFGVIGQREYEIQHRTRQLRALHEAALSLTTELDLASVLQKVVGLARNLVNAKYGALGVLSPDGKSIDQFIVSGIDSGTKEKIGMPPTGKGLLGILVAESKSIRIPEIESDPRAHGFPENHPPMKTFMGVPIKSKGMAIGNLYLVDKISETSSIQRIVEFSERDQQILEMFATQAAIAIENAQLYRQTQQLAILEERDRFGMDLHDGIIQSIFAIGLMLEDAQHQLESGTENGEGIKRAILGLNDVIRDIRNYILDLRPQRFQGRDLVGGVEELVRDLRANSFLEVHFSANGFDQEILSPENTVEILHIVQEALANIRKHARATTVQIGLIDDPDCFEIWIKDNGIGIDMDSASKSVGNGLHNMRERTRHLEGEIVFQNHADSGTHIQLIIPKKV